MATIAKLVMEMEAQLKAGSIRNELAGITRATNSFVRNFNKTMASTLPGFEDIFKAFGRKGVDDLVLYDRQLRKVRDTFSETVKGLRQQRKQKILDPEEFQREFQKAQQVAVKGAQEIGNILGHILPETGAREGNRFTEALAAGAGFTPAQQARFSAGMETLGARASEAMVRGSARVRAVDKIVANLEKEFQQADIGRREARARPSGITKEEFRHLGQQNAAAYNAGITTEMDRLAAKGQLPDTLRQAMLTKLKPAGFDFKPLTDAQRKVQDVEREITRQRERMQTSIARTKLDISAGLDPTLGARRIAAAYEEMNRAILRERQRLGAATTPQIERLLGKAVVRVPVVGPDLTAAQRTFQDATRHVVRLQNQMKTEVARTKLDLAGGLDPRVGEQRIIAAYQAMNRGIQHGRQQLGAAITPEIEQLFAKSLVKIPKATPIVTEAEKLFTDVGQAVLRMRARMQTSIARAKLDVAAGLDPKEGQRRIIAAYEEMNRSIQHERQRLGAAATPDIERLLGKSLVKVPTVKVADEGALAAKTYLTGFRDTYDRQIQSIRLASLTGRISKEEASLQKAAADQALAISVQSIRDRLEAEKRLTIGARQEIARSLRGVAPPPAPVAVLTGAQQAFNAAKLQLTQLKTNLQTELNRIKLDLVGGLDPTIAKQRIEAARTELRQAVLRMRGELAGGPVAGAGIASTLGLPTPAQAAHVGEEAGRNVAAGLARPIRAAGERIGLTLKEKLLTGIAAGGAGSAVSGVVFALFDPTRVGQHIGTALSLAILTSSAASIGASVLSIFPEGRALLGRGIEAGRSFAAGIISSVAGVARKVANAVIPERIQQAAARGLEAGRALGAGALTALSGVAAKIRDRLGVPAADMARRGAEAGTALATSFLERLRGVGARASRALTPTPPPVLPPTGPVGPPRRGPTGGIDPAIEAEMAKLMDETERLVRNASPKIAKAAGEGGGAAGKSFFTAFNEQMESESAKSLTQLANIGQRLGVTLTKFLTVPLTAAGGGMIKLAGDAEQSGRRIQISFGPASVQLNRNLNALRSEIPATSSELQSMASRLGELFVPIGLTSDAVAKMSIDLIKVTKNLSLFAGVSTDRAFNAVLNGLIGQSRELRKLGLIIDDQTIKDRAYREGIARVGAQLTAAQHAQAGYIVIMERSRIIQSTLAQAGDTFNTKLLFFTSRVKEAGIALGSVLLPMMTQMLTIVTAWIDRFSHLTETQKNWIIGLGILLAVLGPLLVMISNITKALVIYRAAALAASLATVAGAEAGGALGLGGLLAVGGPVAIAIGLVTAAIVAYTIATMGASKETETFMNAIAGMSKAGLQASKITLKQSIDEAQLQIANLMAAGVKEQFDAENKVMASGMIPPTVVGGTEKDRKNFEKLRADVERWKNELVLVDKEIGGIVKQEQQAAKFGAAFAEQQRQAAEDARKGLITEEMRRSNHELDLLAKKTALATTEFQKGKRLGSTKMIEQGVSDAREALGQLQQIMVTFREQRADPANAPIVKELTAIIERAETMAVRMKAIVQESERAIVLKEFAATLTEISKAMQLGAAQGDFSAVEEGLKRLGDLQTQVQAKLADAAAEGDTLLLSKLHIILDQIGLLRVRFGTMLPLNTMLQQMDTLITRLRTMKDEVPTGAPVTSTGVPIEQQRQQQLTVLQLVAAQRELNVQMEQYKNNVAIVTKLTTQYGQNAKAIADSTPNMFEAVWGAEFIPQIKKVADAIRKANFAEDIAKVTGDAGDVAAAEFTKHIAAGMKGVLFENFRKTITEQMDRMVKAGLMSPEAAQAAIGDMLQQFMAAFGKMTEGAGGLDVNLTKTEKRLKNIGLATKGIRQIADAFGAAGKNLVRFVDSLELAAQSIAALIEAQKKIETARKAEETRKAAGGKPRSGAAAGVENLLNTIAMVNAAIGAVASIISTISAAAKFLGIGKSELEIEHNRIVKENNKRLAELTSELSGFQLDVAGQGRISAALADPQLIAHGRNAANFDAIGQQYGVTLADTARAAKKYGIEIFDKNGNTIKGALIQLRTAMDAARDAFFVWADTLESDVSKRELERKAFGIETTPLMAVQDWLGDLKKNAPAAFEKFFAGVDLTDMEAVRKAYQNMVKSITDGTFELDKNLTKGLKFDTFEEWLAFVKEGADAFIKLNEATNDLTESMLNVPSWFRTATNRFGAALPGPGELPPITAPTTPTMGVTPTLTPPLGPGGKPTAAAGPGPGTVVTGGVNFTINQQPGEDADALAERIVNKLRRDAFLRTGSSALPGEGEQN